MRGSITAQAAGPAFLGDPTVSGMIRRIVRLRTLLFVIAAVVFVGAAVGLGTHFWLRHEFDEARRCLQDGRPDEARRHIRWCLKVWPASTETHLLASRIERSGRAFGEAEYHLNECKRLEKEPTAAVQLEWLLLRAEKGELEVVVHDLGYAVAQGHPDSPAILETLSRVYLHQLRYVPALLCLNHWLELEPNVVRALDWRGWVLEKLSRQSEAILDYRRALELEPARTAVRLRLANMYLDNENPVEAAPELEKLHEVDPGVPAVLAGLARCRVLQGRTEDARRLFDAGLAADPEKDVESQILYFRGKLELQADETQVAEKWLRRALAVDPYDSASRYALSQCLGRQPGHEAEAAQELAARDRIEADHVRLESLLNGKVEQSPGKPDVPNEIGVLLLRFGQERLGLEWLNEALRRDDKYRPAHAALAAHFKETGQTDLAEKHRKIVEALDAGKRSSPQNP